MVVDEIICGRVEGKEKKDKDRVLGNFDILSGWRKRIQGGE